MAKDSYLKCMPKSVCRKFYIATTTTNAEIVESITKVTKVTNSNSWKNIFKRKTYKEDTSVSIFFKE